MPNRIIEMLPPQEAALIKPELELVELTQDQVLSEQGQEIKDLYFPESGMVSIVTTLVNRTGIETGTVGREGVTNIEVYLGVTVSPNKTLVQVPGNAWRMPAPVFSRLARNNPEFGAILSRYAVATLAVANRYAACNLVHTLIQRCARWLLTVNDNVPGSTFPLTHVYLAQMLGVRRAGVTAAIGALLRQGIITSRRGIITILDLPGLEAAACECQAAIRAYYSP